MDLALTLEELEDVDAVNISLIEVDSRTENVKIVLEGRDLDFSSIDKTLKDMHASIHSVDQVVAGKRVVESVETPQD